MTSRAASEKAMPGNLIRLPLLQTYALGRYVLEVNVPLDLRTTAGEFVSLPFLFDTGTRFTTIPISLAERHEIPLNTSHPVIVRGTTGTGRGVLSPLWFSSPQLPQWQFECACCFTEHDIPQPLLSLTDVVTHFNLRTAQQTTLHPLGSVILQLKRKHGGRQRSGYS